MLLLLAGTGEARDIAAWLEKSDIPAIASLAGATRQPASLPIPTRIGGFGGAAAFEEFLDTKGVMAILDATHPFAARISNRTAGIAQRRGVPYVQLLRPQWEPQDGDNWTYIDREDQAADHISPGERVFLATGRQTLDRFANLADAHIICRQIDPPDGPFPLADGQFLVGRPPFSVRDEIDLFRKLNVDWLVVKNAGGEASRTKLTAANELNLPVLMIRRPPQPNAPRVETVEQATQWCAGLPW